MKEFLERKETLRRIVEESGVRPAVVYVNGLVAHQYTALYRFNQEVLNNLILVDRTDPESEVFPDIPVLASYCVFVRDSGRTFCVEDAQRDERTIGHPKRQEVLSYCGVPLLDRYGEMFGTICHFDLGAQETVPGDVELLEEFARLLQGKVE